MKAIRRARSDDLDQICQIEQAGDATWSKAAFSDEVDENPWFRVSKQNDRIVGFIIGRFDGFDAELLKVSVAPTHRNQGVAKALLRELFMLCKQKRAGRCYLEVNVFNKSAIALYQRAGFKQVGRRKAYYASADKRADAVLMAKAFS